MEHICDDLVAEHRALDELVAVADLSTATPAPGWTVGDQVSHLWFYDQRAVLALTDPDAFRADAEALMHAAGAAASGADVVDPSVALGRALGKGELVRRWRVDRARLVAIARTVDPATRVPWYGPEMGARSFVTARLMETWAHGQDVADGLGAIHVASDRLRHVAHIGVATRAYSFVANGREPPVAPVHVRLDAPSGAVWTWGDDDAENRVSGPAVGFCLVVTQRRHLDDAGLDVRGDVAGEWMSIAQAFAGPPGPGR